MRISAFGLQPHLDRDFVDELGDIHPAFRHLGTDALHVPFAQIEPDPDRVDLDDGRELARVAAADQLADRDLARGDDAVEWGRHRRIAQSDLRVLGVGLRLQYVGARGIAVGTGLVEIGLGRDVLRLQLLLAGEFGFGIDQRRLGPLLGRLRLLQLDLVGLRLDHEQRRALLHRLAVLVFNFLDVSLYARHQFDVVHRGGIAGRLQIGRDRLLHREFDRHLRRGRRDEAVFFPACREQDEHTRAGEQGPPCSIRRACLASRSGAAAAAPAGRHRIMRERLGHDRIRDAGGNPAHVLSPGLAPVTATAHETRPDNIIFLETSCRQVTTCRYFRASQ